MQRDDKRFASSANGTGTGTSTSSGNSVHYTNNITSNVGTTSNDKGEESEKDQYPFMTLQILEACDRLANLSTSTSSSNNHNHSNKHNNTSSSSNSIRNNSNSSNTSASSFRSPKHHHFFPTTVPTGNPKKDKYAFFTANTGTTETIATSATAATFATNTTTATAATATTTITTSTRGTAGTPSTDGKMAFDTMQQHLKTLLRPLVLRDHEVTLTALWSNTQGRYMS